MDLKFYEDFIPYSDDELDSQIDILEEELDEELDEKVGILNIKKEGGKLKVRSSYFKKLAKLKKLLRFLFFKKKKLKAKGGDTTQINKKIDNIKKRIKK